MNRRQTVALGLICVIVAASSLLEGGGYSGAWFMLASVLYPVLIIGSYVVYLLRDRTTGLSNADTSRRDAAYIVVILFWIVMLLQGWTRLVLAVP